MTPSRTSTSSLEPDPAPTIWCGTYLGHVGTELQADAALCRVLPGWQVGQVDAIFVPISGGGLSSGIAAAAKTLQPGIRIILAEPRGAGPARAWRRLFRL